MKVYRYKAVSKSGKEIDGVVEAYDELEAVSFIKRDCDIVLKIADIGEKKKKFDINEPLSVSDKTLTMVSSQFAILLRAGLPMVRVVNMVAEQSTDRLMKRILKAVANDVAGGYRLGQSLAANGEKLPAAFVETVRAGEDSGTLEASFEKLATYFEKSHKMKSKVRGAMMYPIFLSVIAAVVITVVMIVTVPVLTDTFASTGGEMPVMTQMLIAISSFMTKFWWVILGVVIIFAISVKLYSGTESGHRNLSTLSMNAPLLGKVNRMKGAAQFANTMCTLLSAGLPITGALAATGKVIDNYMLGNAVSAAVVKIEEGRRLGDVVKDLPFLPNLLTEMTSVGEESGALEQTLNTIGTYYDGEVDDVSQKAVAMLEPIITVVMGGVIGMIVIAIYLPMFTVYNGM